MNITSVEDGFKVGICSVMVAVSTSGGVITTLLLTIVPSDDGEPPKTDYSTGSTFTGAS